jgi:hypothetical protein
LHRNQVMRSSQICECADLGMTQNILITVDHDTLSVWASDLRLILTFSPHLRTST